MHGWVMPVSRFLRPFLSDLDVSACIFQENVTFNILSESTPNKQQDGTCTKVRKKIMVIRNSITLLGFLEGGGGGGLIPGPPLKPYS